MLPDISTFQWFAGTSNPDQYTDHDNTSILEWDNDSLGSRGFAGVIANARCEDGISRDVVHCHPAWLRMGVVTGISPTFMLNDLSVFRTSVGFLEGARGTDGVRFQAILHFGRGIDEFTGQEYFSYQTRVLDYTKRYDETVAILEADVSFASRQNVRVELRTCALEGSGQDWAIWINPRMNEDVDSFLGIAMNGDSRDRSKIWMLNPSSLMVRQANEERRGDEPYLGGIYFRSVFNRPGSTKVVALDRLHTLATSVQAHRIIGIDSDAALTVSDFDSTNGIGLIGYVFVALERDKRGKNIVRDKLHEASSRLYQSLRLEVEQTEIQINLSAAQTLDDVKEALLAAVSSSGEFDFLAIFAPIIKLINESLKTVVEWAGRYDDQIGEPNAVVIISGISQRQYEVLLGLFPELNEQVKPFDKKFPVSILTENQTFNLDFSGKGAFYTLRVKLTTTSGGWILF